MDDIALRELIRELRADVRFDFREAKMPAWLKSDVQGKLERMVLLMMKAADALEVGSCDANPKVANNAG